MTVAYERLAEKTELSCEEALALKEEIRKRNETGEPEAAVTGLWRVVTNMDKLASLKFSERGGP